MRESIAGLLEGLTVKQLKEVKERSGVVITNARTKRDYVYWLDWCYTVQGKEVIKTVAELVKRK